MGLLEQAGTDSYVLKGCNCKIVFRLDSSFFHQGFQSLRRDGHDRNECRWFWTKKSEPGVPRHYSGRASFRGNFPMIRFFAEPAHVLQDPSSERNCLKSSTPYLTAGWDPRKNSSTVRPFINAYEADVTTMNSVRRGCAKAFGHRHDRTGDGAPAVRGHRKTWVLNGSETWGGPPGGLLRQERNSRFLFYSAEVRTQCV